MYKLTLLLSLLLPLTAVAATDCPVLPLQAERRADLQIPRMGHQVFTVGGEVVVAGGHTTGFVPTPTAEYYSDGAWHLMPMAYPHDQGGMMVTGAGQVLLFGGHEKELGIGQTFTLERYDPAAHSFSGYGCLNLKRCFANALPLDSGCVVISGNWFHDDAIELYDGSRQCKLVKPVAQHRSLPHILRTARDNAIVFSSRDIHGADFDTIIIDRVKGEPFTDALFETWRPYCYPVGYHGSCFIGDETKGEYANLIQVMRGDTAMAIVRVSGETFSLLPTTSPIPMHSQWGPIGWYSHIVADTKAGRAYIEGYGEEQGDHRFYVAAIDYLKSPAPVTLYYSEPQDSAVRCQPILTSDGDLMLTGGIIEHNNNFEPSGKVFLLHVGTAVPPLRADTGASHYGLWAVLALVLLSAGTIAVVLIYRGKGDPSYGPRGGFYSFADRGWAIVSPSGDEKGGPTHLSPLKTASQELMAQIIQLMEEQQLYLNSTLKISDVAARLNTNSTYVSACINQQRGCSFSQYVNAYRVEHAKRLMQDKPDLKLSSIYLASGFSTETSFFRTFKSITGQTPSEWRQDHGKLSID